MFRFASRSILTISYANMGLSRNNNCRPITSTVYSQLDLLATITIWLISVSKISHERLKIVIMRVQGTHICRRSVPGKVPHLQQPHLARMQEQTQL